MKTVIKRALSILIVFLLSLLLNATDSYTDVELIFDEASVFTTNEKQIITDYFHGNERMIENRGLSCLLFGHDYKTEYVYVIEHMVRNSAPRCDEGFYRTNICTKCEDVQVELVSLSFIYCCD